MSALSLRRLRILGLLAAPTAAFANAGVPVGMFSACWTVLLFLPVVWIEGWVLHHELGASRTRAYGTALYVNLASTLVGAALSVVGTFAFLAEAGPFADLATLALYLPLFGLSLLIEMPLALRGFGMLPRPAVRRAVLRANLMSYAFLAIFMLGRFFKDLHADLR